MRPWVRVVLVHQATSTQSLKCRSPSHVSRSVHPVRRLNAHLALLRLPHTIQCAHLLMSRACPKTHTSPSSSRGERCYYDLLPGRCLVVLQEPFQDIHISLQPLLQKSSEHDVIMSLSLPSRAISELLRIAPRPRCQVSPSLEGSRIVLRRFGGVKGISKTRFSLQIWAQIPNYRYYYCSHIFGCDVPENHGY